MLIDTVSFYCPNLYPGLTRLWRDRTANSVLKISRVDSGFEVPDSASVVDRVCPRTGEVIRNVVEWESCPWESLRSDDRSIALQIGSCIKIQGSFARWTSNSLEGISDNVFGDPSLDIVEAVTTLADEVLRFLQVELQSDLDGEWPSSVEDWTVTRCDITENFLLPSYAHVEQVIGLIRSAETGSRVVRDAHGCESVKVGGKRSLYPCLLYAKGPHFKKEMRGRLGPDNAILSSVWQRVAAYDGRPLTDILEQCVTDLSFDLDALLRKHNADDLMCAELSKNWGRAYNIGKALALSSRIFRAEARPPSRWFNEKDRNGKHIHRRDCPWYKLTKDDFVQHWNKTFENLLPWNKEPLTMSNLLDKFQTASVSIGYTPALGQKAYLTWLNIRENGAKVVRSEMSRATFHRHKQIAVKAGLTFAEFDQGSISNIRFDIPVSAKSVSSWPELLAA